MVHTIWQCWGKGIGIVDMIRLLDSNGHCVQRQYINEVLEICLREKETLCEKILDCTIVGEGVNISRMYSYVVCG